MSTEIELILRISAYIFGVAGGVYALRRAIDKLSINQSATQKSLEDIKEEVKEMKVCDDELKLQTAKMNVMMEAGEDFRRNTDLIHGEMFSKVNRLHERVTACETCNNFLKKDIEALKRKGG